MCIRDRLRLYINRKLPTTPSKTTCISPTSAIVTSANGTSSQSTNRRSPTLRLSRVRSPQTSVTGRNTEMAVSSTCRQEGDRSTVGACWMSDSDNGTEHHHHHHHHHHRRDQSGGSRQLTRSTSSQTSVIDTVDNESHRESSRRLCDKTRHNMSSQCQQVVPADVMYLLTWCCTCLCDVPAHSDVVRAHVMLYLLTMMLYLLMWWYTCSCDVVRAYMMIYLLMWCTCSQWCCTCSRDVVPAHMMLYLLIWCTCLHDVVPSTCDVVPAYMMIYLLTWCRVWASVVTVSISVHMTRSVLFFVKYVTFVVSFVICNKFYLLTYEVVWQQS